jgi:hypothetical protein
VAVRRRKASLIIPKVDRIYYSVEVDIVFCSSDVCSVELGVVAVLFVFCWDGGDGCPLMSWSRFVGDG